MNNFFTNIPNQLDKEVMENIFTSQNIRIERILSRGQTSPEQGWYDQDENEWVMVLEGAGILLFETGKQITMEKGDYLHIQAHEKHKVSWTTPDDTTIWLAVFYW
ncbi:MAG: cupin domain-containing protein [Fibrobacteria bacterium]|nr:cupin domain-containing protein [Fibrobacteria bacterium]